MATSPVHVITGATGLVGSAIVLDLLEAVPDARIVCVVRPGCAGSSARLLAALERAARLSDREALLDALRERCEAVAGDLHAAGCGVVADPAWTGAEVWHCAGSMQFHERHRRQVLETNVEGTRGVLALAARIDARAFNYISTAYVAGARSGLIREEPVDPTAGEHANNYYERSKVIAEGLVMASPLAARILRPSVVIGHSRTRGALTYNGLYGFIRGVYKFRRLLERTQAGLPEALEVRMITDPEGHLDFIPVDFVARDAVNLALAGAAPGIYHLAALAGVGARRGVEVIFESVGMRPPRFVDDRAELTWLDGKLDASIAIYRAYLVGAKRFDRSASEPWLSAPAGAGYRFDEDELARFAAHYVAAELAPRPRTTIE